MSDGELKASLPKGRAAEGLTMEEAVELLAARAAKILEEGGVPAKKKRTAGRSAPKKSAGKKKAAAEAEAEVEVEA